MFSCVALAMVFLFTCWIPSRSLLHRFVSKAARASVDHTKLPRLYLPEGIALDASIPVPRDVAHYIHSVMRLKAGSQVRIFNERQGEFVAALQSDGARDQRLTLSVTKKLKILNSAKLTLPCALFIAPIKKTRMKILLEKAAELGVQHIVPVMTQNTQHPIGSAAVEQYRKALIESCEQCERITIPILHESITMDDFVIWRSTGTHTNGSAKLATYMQHNIPTLVCAERLSTTTVSERNGGRVGKPLLAAVQDVLKSAVHGCAVHELAHVEDRVEYSSHTLLPSPPLPLFAIMVGPEGGFTASELNVLAAQKHSTLVSLGGNVLRAETAAIAALSTVASAVQTRDYVTGRVTIKHEC